MGGIALVTVVSPCAVVNCAIHFVAIMGVSSSYSSSSTTAAAAAAVADSALVSYEHGQAKQQSNQ
jgi:hypothetical protein